MLFLVLAATLQLDRVQHSLTGTYRHYQQYVNGVPVLGGEKLEREIGGKTEVVYDMAGVIPSPAEGEGSGRAVDGSRRPDPSLRLGMTTAYIRVNGALRAVRKIIIRTAPLEPYATYVDEETGEELKREPLFWRATARVFDVNPVVKLNDPTLQDQNDAAAAVPDAAYTTVDINNLDAATPLSGPNARIIDEEQPFTVHADPSQLVFDRSQPQFEEVNAYYHIDRAQKYLQSLGYTGERRLVNYAIGIDAHAAQGTDNSYFIETGAPGVGSLFFGDGGTDDAEDSDLMVHEFGHAIEDWIAPGAFGGGNASESRALGEGFGDYWAFSAKYAAAKTSGRDPYCIADWDARCGNDDPSQNCAYAPGANCLRRVDSTKTMADFQRSGTSGTEHENGAIWSSMLRQIFVQLVARDGIEQGRRVADTIVIESHFATPPNPTFAAMAKNMLDADRLLYGGANADAICTAATQRGILTSCELLPKGELTYLQSAAQGIAIPDNDPAGIEAPLTVTDTRDVVKLYVHVDIAHSARGDLRISLIAPDGTEVLLQDSSGDRTDDIHGTYGIDLMPAQPLAVLYGRPANGQWRLRVSDVLPNDIGTLLSWSLVVQFVGDTPLSDRVVGGGQNVIAPVAHAPGANGTMWRSDLRIVNADTSKVYVTLFFYPSGEDGRTNFGAVRLQLEAGQAVALDDVVAEQFKTVGSGQLQISTSFENLRFSETPPPFHQPHVIANARTYTNAPHGTYGQFTPAVPTSSGTVVNARPQLIGLLQNNAAFRSNIGFAEVMGGGGTVRVRLYDVTDSYVVSESTHHIEPLSHLQIPVTYTSDALTARVDVIDGNAFVVAYGTVVDNRTGDPIYVPANSAAPGYAPVISADGAFGTHWTSDVWAMSSHLTPTFVNAATGEHRTATIDPAGPDTNVTIVKDIVATPFGSRGSFGLLHVDQPSWLRTWTPGDSGTFGEFVPFRQSTGDTVGPVESSRAFRTNIGLANVGDATAPFRIILHDASGKVIATRDLTLHPEQLVQFPIQEMIGSLALRSGWANVQGTSPVLFYASVVDNASGDAVHIPAQ